MAGSRFIVKQATPNSAEKMALDLMERIAFIEWKRIGPDQEYCTKTNREWLLDTYAECLQATKGLRNAKSSDELADLRPKISGNST
jgi:hypothetical protein